MSMKRERPAVGDQYTHVAPSHMQVIRFRGLNAQVRSDERGEFLEIAVPGMPIPEHLPGALREAGLRESQAAEVIQMVGDLCMTNYIMEHQDRQ